MQTSLITELVTTQHCHVMYLVLTVLPLVDQTIVLCHVHVNTVVKIAHDYHLGVQVLADHMLQNEL